MRIRIRCVSVLLVVLVLGWSGVAGAACKLLVVTVPVHYAEPNIKLGSILIRDESFASKIPENSSINIALSSGKITNIRVVDYNSVFGSVNSIVYNDANASISWGNRVKSSGSLLIEIVADLTGAPPGDVKALISGNAISDTQLILARIHSPYNIPPREPRERSQYLFDKIYQLNAAGIYSDDEVSCVLVDLSQISTTGSVTSYTYENTTSPVVNSFTSRTMPHIEAVSNMTRYILGNIRTVYIDPPFNCSIAMSVYERTSIPVYVYGVGKAYCIDEIEQALPSVFAIKYVKSDSGGSRSIPQPDQPIVLPVAEQILNTMFSINTPVYVISSNEKSETKIMDVTPEIKDNRFFIPVRYLANSLGVNNENIKWDGETKTATIQKNETSINLTIGSNTSIVRKGDHKAYFTMDVAPYIKNGRTMLPARWVAEPLGATVKWNETTQQVTVEIPQEQGL